MLDAKYLARVLGGEARGKHVHAPGPGHSTHDRSLSVLVDAAAVDGFVVNSFSGDDPILCRDYVRNRLGLPEWQPSVNGGGRTKGNASAESAPAFAADTATESKPDDAERTNRAIQLFKEAEPI